MNTKSIMRFWEKVVIAGLNDCWEWNGAKNKKGYGNVRVNKKYINAHRVSYEISKGTVPKGMCVMHKCDNPKCVNPNHLSVGTYSENFKDSVSKGRWNVESRITRGEQKSKAKLTWKKAEEIRRRRANGETGVALGKEYGVSSTVIYDITNNKIWKTPLEKAVMAGRRQQ